MDGSEPDVDAVPVRSVLLSASRSDDSFTLNTEILDTVSVTMLLTVLVPRTGR